MATLNRTVQIGTVQLGPHVTIPAGSTVTVLWRGHHDADVTWQGCRFPVALNWLTWPEQG